MKIVFPIFINIIFVVLFYLFERIEKFKYLNKYIKQLIIGVTFGIISIIGSELGMEISGATMNVRDSAPLSAGLIFGWEAGLIAGIIGGGYRALSVLWGGGTYTALACSISTILAGVVAAILRKFMFDDKKPSWPFAMGITVVMEVFHMLMIFLTNLSDANTAFTFVKMCTIPMVILNSLTVGVSVLLVTILSKERILRSKSQEQIAQTFQRWLILSVLIAFISMSIFTYNLQTSMRQHQIEDTFRMSINDVIKDITEQSDSTLLSITDKIRKEYIDNQDIDLKQLAEKHDVAEINIVSSNGMIVKSNIDDYINNFNMNSTEQSAEFMILTNSTKIENLVQKFGPIGNDNRILRKYAGISLSNGGFIQVGYDDVHFYNHLDKFVIDFTKNRHVGANGFIAVCDEKFNLVTDTDKNNKPINIIGIEPNDEMLNKNSASNIYTTTIINSETNYQEKYLYVFTFAEGYCIIAAMPDDEAMLIRDASAYLSIFMLIMTFATLFVILYFLIKKIVINNINKINSTLSKITSGDLNQKVNVRGNIEFAILSDDINATVETLKKYIKEAAARIDQELEYAKQIQLSALPNQLPSRDEFEIYADMIAAKEIGGDFYDFYLLDDNHLAFLVADVSGKGIPAAMFMMSAKTIIKDLAERGILLNEIFTLANEKLCENNESGMFVTAWMGILDITTGKLLYVNAGHNPPVIFKDGKYEYLKSRSGFVLAGMEGYKYKLNELQLNEGDKIFLYTDGVTEANNSNNELYGEERLNRFLNENYNLTLSELLPSVKRSIDEFVGDAPQFDDITMLIFEFKNGNKLYDEKTFSANIDQISDVMEFIENKLDEYDCSVKVKMSLTLVVEEIFVNICNYAYQDKHGYVKFIVEFTPSNRNFVLKLEDSGIPFNPLLKQDPDVSLSADERDIGGLGIFITKKIMDDINYCHNDGKNILTITKKI